MGGTYTIYAYFNQEQIQSVLNAIVMLVGAGGTNGDYLSLIRVAAMLGLFLAVTLGFVRARGEDAAQYLIMVAIFYSTLFVPRVTVIIEEAGGNGGAPVSVDNVPLGLAFFASTTSHIGHWLTEQTETFFALPDTELQLSHHGLMGGARALREAQNANIQDPVLAADLVSFMRDCINPELLSDPSKVNSLLNSTDLWTDFNGLTLINNGRLVNLLSVGTTVDCGTAYTSVIPNAMAPAVTTVVDRVARIISPYSTPSSANTTLASMLPAAEGLIMTASASAAASIKQRMLINMMNDTSSSLAQIMNDPAAAQTALGETMAASSANSGYRITAKLAAETLPIIRNAIELVIIGVFPIMLIIIIIAGTKGGVVLRSYVMTMLWLQLWAPMYAIVNFVGTMAHAKSAKAALGGIDGLAIANAAAFANSTISSEAVVGILTITVPMIALALVKGGEVAMSGVVSSVTGGASSASSRAGEAVATGNISLGNTSWGNGQYNNVGGNKSNTAFGHVDPGMGNIKNADVSYDIASDGRILGAKANTSDIAGTVAAKRSVGARNSAESGERSDLQDKKSADLTQMTGGGYTREEGERVANAFSKRITDTFGGGNTYNAGDTAKDGKSSNHTTSNAAGSVANDQAGVKSRLGISAGVGDASDIGAAQTVTEKSAIPGAPKNVKGAVGNEALEAAKQVKSGRTVRGKLGVDAGTGFDVASTDTLTDTANRGKDSKKQKEAAKNFEVAEKAMNDVVGSKATVGEKAAARAIMGSLAERLDAKYGTNLSATYGTHASNSATRSDEAGVSVSNPYYQERLAQTMIANLGGGDPTRAVQEARKDPGVLESNPAMSQSVAETVQSVAPKGESSRGLDGNITPPTNVAEHRQASADAVESRNSENQTAATNKAREYLARGIAAQHAKPDSMPDQSRAQEALEGTKKKATDGQEATGKATQFENGLNQLVAEFHAGDRGALSAVGRAFAGPALQAIGAEHYSGEQYDRIAALAATDPKVAQAVMNIGETGKVKPGDIELIGRSELGHNFSQKMDSVGNSVKNYVNKYLGD